MAKIHNETGEALRTESERMAIYHLIKKVGSDKAHDVLRDINFYPDPETFAEAKQMVDAENGAMKDLNRMFGFNQ